jgi:ribosomal protein S4
MIYPAYQLNPGDMFQVKPERVLFATGAPKDRGEAREDRRERRRLKAGSTDSSNSEPAVPAAEVIAPDPEATLLSLRQQVSTILSTTSPSAKRKQSLRALQRLLKSTLATHPTTLTDDVDAQLLELTSRLNISTPTSTPIPENSPTSKTAVMSSDERRRLREALALARENPIDLTKPYATPWRPRDYMSAFAFIPRYLEVHHRICSAVYLRHPVARPGLGEVPTPFPSEMNALAFNWYLRRR